uniref:Uncharacterized protein TCIL3000_11_13600 n=1 Tax=Trypanosoma congolense (strain IL3000) TaxID=1068625 RepID=G0V2I2_TRYCI|nr:unnamed protein product [Trypanosoma congolense IL3000]
MSLFYGYVMRDVVEVEPVYLPDRAGTAPPSRGTCDTEEIRPYQVTVDDVLLHRLTERYVGKMIPSLGLCVAIQELIHHTPGTVRGSAASVWFTAEFRVCVFAPTPGARLRATISAQTREGIYLSLDFFHFVLFVPGDQLISPSFFDERSMCWALSVEDVADEDAVNPYEKGDEVIVRVDRVVVRDPTDLQGSHSSRITAIDDVSHTSGAGAGVKGVAKELDCAQWPMEVYGSFLGTGLGPVMWF